MIQAKTVQAQIKAARAILKWYDREVVDKQWLLDEWRMFNKLQRTTDELDVQVRVDKLASLNDLTNP